MIERIIFEREARPSITADGRFTAPGVALSAGLSAGTLRLDRGRVVCASGHPARWKAAAGQWGPDYGELGQLEQQGLDVVGG
jgi:hypothetical protein